MKTVSEKNSALQKKETALDTEVGDCNIMVCPRGN